MFKFEPSDCSFWSSVKSERVVLKLGSRLRCRAHAETGAHSSFSPCALIWVTYFVGRLGRTISPGFVGIGRTSGPRLNLNIWMTEKACKHVAVFTIFPNVSSPKLNRRAAKSLLVCFYLFCFLPSSVYSFPFSLGTLIRSAHITSSPALSPRVMFV